MSDVRFKAYGHCTDCNRKVGANNGERDEHGRVFHKKCFIKYQGDSGLTGSGSSNDINNDHVNRQSDVPDQRLHEREVSIVTVCSYGLLASCCTAVVAGGTIGLGYLLGSNGIYSQWMWGDMTSAVFNATVGRMIGEELPSLEYGVSTVPVLNDSRSC